MQRRKDDERIEGIEKVLYGNGRKGIIERLIRIEVQIWIIYIGLIAMISMLVKLLLK